MSMMQKFLFGALDELARSVEDALVGDVNDIRDMLSPETYSTRDEMMESWKKDSIDPQGYWDKKYLNDQYDGIVEDASSTQKITLNDNREACIDDALTHFDNLRETFLSRVLYDTIHSTTGINILDDNSNLDLSYLIESEIFGVDYPAEDDDADTDSDDEDEEDEVIDIDEDDD